MCDETALERRKMAPGEDIPDDLKTLAEACTIHYRGFSRLWAFAATVTFLVIASTPQNGTFEMLGIHMSEALFYPVAAVFLIILNVNYCSAHLQAYRIQEMFAARLKYCGADSIEFTERDSLKDVAHALYAPAFTRLYPISHFLPESMGRYFKYPKLLTDALFIGFPIFGCGFAACKGGLFGPAAGFCKAELHWMLVVVFCILFVLSLIPTLALMARAFKSWREWDDRDNR